MKRYLDMAEVSRHVGLAPQTVRALRVQGQMPEPDAMVGRQPGWLLETIDQWTASRSGTPPKGR